MAYYSDTVTLQHDTGDDIEALKATTWVNEIVSAADQAGIPVFLKNNLKPLVFHGLPMASVCITQSVPSDLSNLQWWSALRQEMPGE